MIVYSDELQHHGVKGMQWGKHLFDKTAQIRHKIRSRISPMESDFHNKDGTRTDLGKESYFLDKRDYSSIQNAAKKMREADNSAWDDFVKKTGQHGFDDYDDGQNIFNRKLKGTEQSRRRALDQYQLGAAQRREQYHKLVSDLIAKGGSDRTLHYSKYKKKIEEGRSIIAKRLAEEAYQGRSYEAMNDILQYATKHRERSRSGIMIKADYR